MKRTRSRIAAVLGFVGVLPALVVVALLAFELSFPADGLRPRVMSALSAALGCPLTIAGSLHVISGTRPGIEGRDVRLAECRTIRVARASAELVRVRVNLWALFSHDIRLVEVSGVRLEAEVPTDAPLAAVPSAEAPSRWAFGGITRLHVAPARVLVRSASAPPRTIDLTEVEGAARSGQPMRLTLRGMYGEEAWEITAATAKLGEAIAGLERWPLDLQVAFAGASVMLHGSWTPDPIGLQGDLALKTPAAERLVTALGATSPKLGELELSGNLSASAEHASLDTLGLSGPAGKVSGDAHVSWKGVRPRLDITLKTQQLDYAALERWRAVERGQGSVETAVTRIFERLRAVDGSLSVSIGRVVNAPVSAADAEYSARVEDGRLKLTNILTVDGVPGAISLHVDARGPYAVDGHVSVKAIPGTAVEQVRSVVQIDPRIGSLSANLVARGETIQALLEDLHGQAAGRNIRLVLPMAGGRHDVTLRTVDLEAGRGRPVRASAAGTFGGEPLELELAGDHLIDLLKDEPWTAERLRARVGSARLTASGDIERPLSTRTARLKFELAAPRLEGLAPFFGGATLPRVPATLRGSADLGPDGWRVEATTLAIGATRGSGRVAGRRGAPIEFVLDLQNLAGDELTGIAGPSRPGAKEHVNPIPPDLDLSLKAREARYAGQRFDALNLDARVRDGAVHAPFSLGWSGAKIDGTLDAELRKESVRVTGDATAHGLDLVRVPKPLQKAGITGNIDRVTVRVDAQGASPAALPPNAAFSVQVAKAALRLPQSDTFPEGAGLALDGEARASAAAPIEFSLEGTFRDKPFTASGQLPPVGSLYPAAKPHAVRLAVDYDRSRLEVAGEASIDAAAPRFSGTVKLSGDTLHTLADLAGFSARGFGPYAITTSVEADSKQVAARDLRMQLGKSRFSASLSADPRGQRPRIAAKVSGSPVHLEDIGAQALAPANLEKSAANGGRGERISQATLDRDARVLTHALRALDFDLDVNLEKLSSAGEAIGRAQVRAKLADGRLSVAPLTVWVDRGKFDAEIDVDVRGKAPRYTMKFEGTGFDYGPVLRAVDPKSPAKGKLDLSLDLKSSGAPEALVENATGTLDILILPEGQLAGRLDVLGAGILRLIMGTLDPNSESRLNCVVGSFDVNDGIARSRVVLLDTTRARVAGDLELDFRDGSLNGQLASSSKRPELFSVVPGVEIAGTVDNPVIAVSTKSVVVGMLRLWQVPVAFVGDWIARKDVPADGTPECRAAYRRVLQ